MSEAAKTRPTRGVEVSVGGKQYLVPKTKARAILSLVEPYEVEEEDWRESFKDVFKKHGGEFATILKGARYKAELTQQELAKKTGIRQSHISEMEKGRRQIGLAVAKKLAAALDVDYRVFL